MHLTQQYDDQVLDRVPGIRVRNTSWAAWLCVLGYFSVMIAVIASWDPWPD